MTRTVVLSMSVLLAVWCGFNGAATSARSVQGRNSISGFVFDTMRRPVRDIYVELKPRGGGGDFGRVRTDGSGRYRFGNLSDGNYTVEVLPYGTEYVQQSRDVELFNPRADYGAQFAQEDFYLRAKNSSSGTAVSSAPGTVFVQEVPAPARENYDKAVAELEAKRIEPGLAGLRKAIELFPNYYAALERLGSEYVQRNQRQYYEAAIMILSKAVEVNPRGYLSHYALGIALYNLKQNDKAILSLQKAAELAPNSVNPHLWLGIAAMRAGQTAQAEKSLKRAYALSGGKVPDVHMYLARIYSDSKRYREAVNEIELLMKEDPTARDNESIKKLLVQLREKAKQGS